MKVADRHLGYCTNVQPAHTADEVLRMLERDVPPVCRALGRPGPFGVGLRISDAASRDLVGQAGLEALQQRLDEHDLYVFTLNGFPYGPFHGVSVKDRVHRPDWTEPARLDYLRRLAEILAGLRLPDDEGSISTSPLGYRMHHADPDAARRASAEALATLCLDLRRLEDATGRRVHVDLEPEPDGLLEQLGEARRFFVDELLVHGRDHLAQLASVPPSQAEGWLRRYLGVCFDVCHAAVVFEPIAEGLRGVRAEGIGIGKIQLSSAIEASFADPDEARAVASALERFDEPVYLHQVAVRRPDGGVVRFPDLGPALEALQGLAPGTLRTHFHVPLFLEDYGPLTSTQAAVLETLGDLGACRHLEVETYTWGVLPDALQTELSSSIARELSWVLDHTIDTFDRTPERTEAP